MIPRATGIEKMKRKTYTMILNVSSERQNVLTATFLLHENSRRKRVSKNNFIDVPVAATFVTG